MGAVVTTTSSAKNRELCVSLGASEALDYALDAPFSGSRKYRVVLDAFGNQGFFRVRRSLTEDGIYVTTVPSARIAFDSVRTIFGHPRARLVMVKPRRHDLETIAPGVARSRRAACAPQVSGWLGLAPTLACRHGDSEGEDQWRP